MNKFIGLLVMVWSMGAFADVPVHEDRNEAEYNNQYAVVLNGYDPVSYFSEGGATPAKGDASISFVYGTRMYHFMSEENLNLFKTNPLKYEPTYGSYCAYAMSENAKIKINPLIYTINGNRAHFFVSKSAKGSFDAELAVREVNADNNWMNISGEAPRK